MNTYILYHGGTQEMNHATTEDCSSDENRAECSTYLKLNNQNEPP